MHQAPKSLITFLKTCDLQVTSHFYTHILGFSLALDQGKCRIFRVCDSAYLGFCLTDGDTGSPEVILTLEVPDVDEYCRHLEEQGIAIEIRPRYNEYYRIYQMFIRDPNGYSIEIQEFRDPRWNAGG